MLDVKIVYGDTFDDAVFLAWKSTGRALLILKDESQIPEALEWLK